MGCLLLTALAAYAVSASAANIAPADFGYSYSRFGNWYEHPLINLFFLPYESTTTLARHYEIISPPLLEVDGMLTTALNSSVGEALGTALEVPRGIPFYIFNPEHAKAAEDLIQVLRDAPRGELLQTATGIRDHVNEAMFLYALYRTFIDREELRQFQVPPLAMVLPDRFVPAKKIHEAIKRVRDAISRRKQEDVYVYWHVNETGNSNRFSEHRVAYWREDLFLNSHHWHWHLSNVYNVPYDRPIDRRGEIFYYMHHNMVARYNMERLSVNLHPVLPFHDWRSPIPDGYFPHINLGSGSQWGNRQDNTDLNDVFPLNIDGASYITQMEIWKTHIFHSIDVGYLVSKNKTQVRLTDNPLAGERLGIDLLGDAVESSNTSVNMEYYGSLHNVGHDMLSQSHDPTGKHQSKGGVMGSTETAIRDPVFFRWHKFIDDLFYSYKLTQPHYHRKQLLFPGVEVLSVKVQDLEYSRSPENLLHTFFTNASFEASRGIDFRVEPEDHVNVFFTSSFLNHTDFAYEISVNNTRDEWIKPTVRIFLAPKYDADGRKMSYATLMRYWTEMDVFVADSIPPGQSTIRRNSTESSVSWKYHGPNKSWNFAYSECAWPQHLLLPRGLPDGMVFRLFVMISDATFDRVNSEPSGTFCGRPDAKYPDRWPMGFPLDRKTSEDTIEGFVEKFSNMVVQDVVIEHSPTRQEEDSYQEDDGGDYEGFCSLIVC